MKNVEALSVTDSSGRQVSLLNNESAPPDHLEKRTTPTTPSAPPPPSLPPHVVQHNVTSLSPPNANTHQPVMYNQTPNTTQWTSYRQQRSATAASSSNDSNSSRRKYHCTEPGCNKSFTTSGHLARHNRIHTGEKNFPCLFPGCQSRFSRQDNMMQHYRTHMSPKSRRSHKRNNAGGMATNTMEDDTANRPRPRLHAHHRIRSDPFGVERPLTIDQHLNNYRLSRLSSPPVSPDQPMDHSPSSPSYPAGAAAGQQQQQHDLSALSASLQQQSLSDHHSHLPNTTLHPLSSSQQQPSIAHMDTATFYQHRPLTFSLEEATNTNQVPAPTTLLGPSINEQPMGMAMRHEQQRDRTSRQDQQHQKNSSSSSTSSSSDGLLQLAHVVSTFG